MFDKILEKTEGAMTQLSKALSSFEQDSNNLSINLEKKIDEYRQQLRGELDKLDTLTLAKIDEKKKEIDIIFETYQKNLNGLLEKDLHDFSKVVKDRFESIYAEYEVEAADKARAIFENDIEDIFKKYGDKLAPYILKSLLKHIFRFGRKTP